MEAVDTAKRKTGSISPENDHEAVKRFRTANFSYQERNVLIQIVEKYQDVINGVKNDKVSVLKREVIWEDIAAEFNDVMHDPVRLPRQLKQCYKNILKRISKERRADAAKHMQIKQEGHSAIMQPAVGTTMSENSNSSQYLESSFDEGGSPSLHPEVLIHQGAYPLPIYGHTDSTTGEGHAMEDPLSRITDIAQLQQRLLRKQIESVNLDIIMKIKKHKMELQVEQAKLEYYKKKYNDLQNTN